MPHRTCVLTFILLITLMLAFGDGLAGPVPDTGQTTCYDTSGNEIACPQPGEAFYGQDGSYTINPPAYTKLDASGNDLAHSATSWVMVRDNVTGLIWEVKADDGSIHDRDNRYTWYDSNPATNGGSAGTSGSGTDTEDFIAALNAAGFGGYSDWRLPTSKELRGIVDYGRFNPSIDTAYFPQTVASCYWSSTPYANGIDVAWCMNFLYGFGSHGDKSLDNCVRAVRGEQTQSAFTDNADGTVTDTSSGLMWQQATAPGTYTWTQALSYCDGLSLGGHTDWRLPTIKELDSIVDLMRFNPSSDTSYFPDTVASYYWSSTTSAGNAADALSMFFYSGYGKDDAKSYSDYVRAVRGGQSGSSGDLAISQAVYQFDDGDTPSGFVDIGGGVTLCFAGDILVGVIDKHLGFYLGSRPVPSLMAVVSEQIEAASLSFTFEQPIKAFTVKAADFEGNTTISAYDSGNQLVETVQVKGSTAETYELVWEQSIEKIVISSSSGWVGTTAELANILGRILSQADGSPIEGVTVTIVPSNRQAASDLNGNYSLTGIKPGTYTLTGTGQRIATTHLTGLSIAAGSTLSQDLHVMTPVDGGYSVTADLWAKAVLAVSGSPVPLVWQEVGVDTTPSGDQVISGYFYADPADFAYGSPYNPELFVKIYIAASGWCNMAFNHVTVDPVSIDSAHGYAGAPQQSGSVILENRLLEHRYTGVNGP